MGTRFDTASGTWVDDGVAGSVDVNGLLGAVLGRQTDTNNQSGQNTTGTTGQTTAGTTSQNSNGTQNSTQNSTGTTANNSNTTGTGSSNTTGAQANTSTGTSDSNTAGTSTGTQSNTGASTQVTSNSGNQATTGTSTDSGSQSTQGTTANTGTTHTTGTVTSNNTSHTGGTNTSVSNADTAALREVYAKQSAGISPDMLAAIFQQGYKNAGNVQLAQTNALGARGVGNSPAAQALNMMNLDLTAKAADLNRQMLQDSGSTAQAIANATKSTTDTTDQTTNQTNVQVQDLLAATDTKSVVNQLVDTLNNTNSSQNIANTSTGTVAGTNTSTGTSAQNTTQAQTGTNTQSGTQTNTQNNTQANTQNTAQTGFQNTAQTGTQVTANTSTGTQNQTSAGTQTQNTAANSSQQQHTTINTNVAKSLAGMIAAGIGIDQVLKAATGQGFVGTAAQLLSYLNSQSAQTGITLPTDLPAYDYTIPAIDPMPIPDITVGDATDLTNIPGGADGGALTAQGNISSPYKMADGGFLPVPDLMHKIKQPIIDPDTALINSLLGSSSSSSSTGVTGSAGTGAAGGDTGGGAQGNMGITDPNWAGSNTPAFGDTSGATTADGNINAFTADGGTTGTTGTYNAADATMAGIIGSVAGKMLGIPLVGSIAKALYGALTDKPVDPTSGFPTMPGQQDNLPPTDTTPATAPQINTGDTPSPGPGPNEGAIYNVGSEGMGGGGGEGLQDLIGGSFGAGSGSGSGYYEDACVAINSVLPGGHTAGEVGINNVLLLGDEDTLEPSMGVVTYSKRATQPGWRIVTQSGASLRCSASAPIPTTEGLVLAPHLLSKQVAVLRNTAANWELVTHVESIGDIEVQHISVNDKCFWAGETPDAFILHHNKADGGLVEAEDSAADKKADSILDDDQMLKALGVMRDTAPNGQVYFSSAAVQSVQKALLGEQGTLSPGVTSQDRGSGGKGYSDGGRIVGPGTGISDSIPAQGPGGKPLRVANNEYIIPADVVAHFGVDAFDNMVKAIHTPAAVQRRG